MDPIAISLKGSQNAFYSLLPYAGFQKTIEKELIYSQDLSREEAAKKSPESSREG
jgi:hypothetical protein